MKIPPLLHTLLVSLDEVETSTSAIVRTPSLVSEDEVNKNVTFILERKSPISRPTPYDVQHRNLIDIDIITRYVQMFRNFKSRLNGLL